MALTSTPTKEDKKLGSINNAESSNQLVAPKSIWDNEVSSSPKGNLDIPAGIVFGEGSESEVDVTGETN
jgi:hypothetical protein